MADSSSPVLRYEKRDGRAYLTLNRPAVRNALNRALMAALFEAVADAERDPNVLVLVLAAEGGRAFSAGADLKELSALDTAGEARGFRSSLHRTDALAECAKPVIAAIDGYCLAGGFELALRCDIRIATEQSTFGLPEPRHSLMAGYGLHQLSRMIPLGEALLMQLSGATMTCQRAHDIGLIQKRVADRAALIEAVEAVADDICLCAPLAVQGIKKIVNTGRHLPVDESYNIAAAIEESVYSSEDRREGPRAFAEKRKPNWKMR